MKQEILNLIEASEKMTVQLQSLIGFEQEKRLALLRQEADKIDSLVQAQQAMVMKLDSLEKKRLSAQNAAGFAGKSAHEVLEIANTEEAALLRPVFEALQSAALELQGINRTSAEIANAELKVLERLSLSKKEEVRGLYGANGKTGAFSHTGTGFQEKI